MQTDMGGPKVPDLQLPGSPALEALGRQIGRSILIGSSIIAGGTIIGGATIGIAYGSFDRHWAAVVAATANKADPKLPSPDNGSDATNRSTPPG